MLVDYRFDLLGWNPEMAALMLDFDELPADQRNTLWLCLMHPALRDFYVDRERIIRECIAELRAACAAHPDDAALTHLIAMLTACSEEFARLWELRDVKVNGRGHKRLHHPKAGPLTVAFEVLAPVQDPHQRLVIYRAADPTSQAALDTLIGREAVHSSG